MKSVPKKIRELLYCKKGQVSALWAFALGLVVLFIVVATGARILTTFQATDASAVSYFHNITESALEAIDDFSDWFGILVVAGVAGVVLILIIKYLVPNLRYNRGGY